MIYIVLVNDVGGGEADHDDNNYDNHGDDDMGT